MSYELERESMVSQQLIPRGISDSRVLDAFRRVPRHEFVAPSLIAEAHADHPLGIGGGQTISQPYMVALMTECLRLKETEKVLEIGTGSGYQAAILAGLCKEVYSVERFQSLAEKAQDTLERLDYRNIKIKIGDGTLGWEEYAPYDGIIVTAGAPEAPKTLIKQLKVKGRLVIPIGGSFSQVLTVIEKQAQDVVSSEVCGCVFVPLVGKEGWQESPRN